VHLGFETVVPFGRGRTGLARITTHKDRFGFLTRPHAAELELRSDPDTFAVSWEFRAAHAEAASANGWRPTVLMDRVLEHIASAAYAEPLTRNALANSVRGKRETLLQAIDFLVLDGRLTIDHHKRVVPVPGNVPGTSLLDEGNGHVPRSLSTRGNAFRNAFGNASEELKR
jgi:hypothetical protein